MGSVPTVYVSASQCPSCDRLLKIMSRLKLKANVIDVDQTSVEGLQAVPTAVVDSKVLVGTDVFAWLQEYEATISLEEYATVLGSDGGGMPFTDLESDTTENACPFAEF